MHVSLRWSPAAGRLRAQLREWLRRIPWSLVGASTIGIVVLLLHTRRFPEFFFDDSFISLRYADRLRSGEGFTWTDGDRVEGCTNFLWVVLIAGLGLMNKGLITPTRVMGIVCVAIGLVALVWVSRGKGWRESAAAWFAALGVATLGPVAAWSVGGLEVSLILAGLGCSLAFAYAMLDRTESNNGLAIGLGGSLAVLTLTRPDGALFTVAFTIGLVVARGLRRAAWRDAIVAGGISTLAFSALSLFRRLYFGTWVPNTSFKVVATKFRIHDGWSYITRDHELWWPLLCLMGLAIVFAFKSSSIRKRFALLVPALLLWLAYVTLIGGDFMPQRRHLVPALFLLVAMAAEAIRFLVSQRGAAAMTAWYLGLSSCGIVMWMQRDDWAVGDANNGAWYWAGRPIGAFFRDAFGDKNPLLAVDAAGSLPYFSKLRALDMLGLNDRYLATHPPKLTGTEDVSHALGDGAYVLGRKPDIVVFHLPWGREQPMFRSGKEMVKLPGFAQNYQAFYYVTPSQSIEGIAFLRHRDGPLAPSWEGNRIKLPLYLLASSKLVRATLCDGGSMCLKVAANGRGSYAGLSLGSGRCRASIEATAGVFVTIRSGQHTAPVTSGRETTFEASEGKATIEVRAGEKAGTLHSVEIDCSGEV